MHEKVRNLIRLLQDGSQTGQDICRQMDVSRPTLTRLMEDCRKAYPGFLCQIGSARSTRYAWAASTVDHPNLPWVIPVYEVSPSGSEQRFGQMTVLLKDEYQFELDHERTARRFPKGWIREHYEGIPWFLQDARPQGYLGRALAQRLFLDRGSLGTGVEGLAEPVHQWNDAQVLQIISRFGNDLPGCFVVGAASAARNDQKWEGVSIPVEARPDAYALRVREIESGQWMPHSSAGGEQPKFTACVRDEKSDSWRPVLVKFSPPLSGNADRVSRRWRDLLIAEFHALSVLAFAGVSAAVPDLLQGSDDRWFLESPRFDRSGQYGRIPIFSLRTILLETVGDLPAWVTSAERLHEQGMIDTHNKQQMLLMDAYGHFIGNTDRHPGNLSFMLAKRPDDAFGKFALAPAYDMLPMQYAPDTQGSMVPDFRAIPPYSIPHDQVSIARGMAVLFWSMVACDIRVSNEFRDMAMDHAEALAARLPVDMGKENPVSQDGATAAEAQKVSAGVIPMPDALPAMQFAAQPQRGSPLPTPPKRPKGP